MEQIEEFEKNIIDELGFKKEEINFMLKYKSSLIVPDRSVGIFNAKKVFIDYIGFD
jgi:hypothetical protein